MTDEDQLSYPHMDGEFIVIGPQCFANHDGSVLNWKGVNYVPQKADRRVETEASEFEDKEEADSITLMGGKVVPIDGEDELDSCAIPKSRLDTIVPQ